MVRERMQVTSVPYRGAAPALADLVAGQVQAKLDTYTTAAQLVADKKLNALAVTASKRLKQLPNVPTVMESGVPDDEGYLWMGIVAPAGTPQPILDRLAAAIRRMVEAGRHPGPFRQGRRRAGRQFTRRVQGSDQPGDCAMARSRKAGRHQGGMNTLLKWRRVWPSRRARAWR